MNGEEPIEEPALFGAPRVLGPGRRKCAACGCYVTSDGYCTRCGQHRFSSFL